MGKLPVSTSPRDRRQAVMEFLTASDGNPEAALYTVPQNRQAVVRVFVQEMSNTTPRLSIRLQDADSNQRYIVYLYEMAAYEYNYTEELWIEAGGKIKVTVTDHAADVQCSCIGYTVPKDTG